MAGFPSDGVRVVIRGIGLNDPVKQHSDSTHDLVVYDQVKTRRSESEAEAEEESQSQSMGMCIVIGSASASDSGKLAFTT